MFDAHREAIERMYLGKCTIIELEDEVIGSIAVSAGAEKVVAEDMPCKIVRKSTNPSIQTDSISEIDYNVVLYINPDIKINSGSKIVVTQNGVTAKYERAGEPFVYPTHQEIGLKRTTTA